VSRLAISKIFRRRAGDSFYGGDPRSEGGSHLAASARKPRELVPPGPEIFVGILKYLYHETKRSGVTHWLIAIDRGLDIAVRRMGWPFVAVGPEVDYYGPVRPYLADVSLADRVLASKNPRLFAFLNEGLPQETGVASRVYLRAGQLAPFSDV
jgi:N-acyl amino acid synthase of PEP-CTERM/exosortase system